MRAVWGAFGVVLALAACGRVDLPVVGFSPGPAAGLEDRVWQAEGDDGALRVFLSDGTLMQAACGGPWRLSAWRRVGDTELVWEDGEETLRAVIALQGPRELVLVTGPEGATRTEAFRRVQAPRACDG